MQDKNRKDNRIEKPRKKSYYIDKYKVHRLKRSLANYMD